MIGWSGWSVTWVFTRGNMPSLSRTNYITMTIVIILAVAGLGQSCHRRALDDHARRSAAELAEARLEGRETEVVLQAVIDSLQTAVALRAASDSARPKGSVSPRVVREIVRDTTVDDSVRAVVGQLAAENDSLRTALAMSDQAYQAAAVAAAALQDRLTVAQARIATLTAIIEDTPGERSWFIPQLTAGATACICGGDLAVGPGVTLGWEIPVGK